MPPPPVTPPDAALAPHPNNLRPIVELEETPCKAEIPLSVIADWGFPEADVVAPPEKDEPISVQAFEPS